MSSYIALSEKQIQIELARRSLKHFVKSTMPEYQFNWHNEVLIDKLESFCKKEIKRLMVFMPPRHGKSQLVSRHLPAYLFGQDPDTRVIACSYSANLASAMNRDVQRILDSEEYIAIYPESRINSKTVVTSNTYLRNSTVFEIVEKKGYYISAGIGGAITGKGADFAIIDDPVKNSEEARSSVIREKHWDWYTSTFYTRLEKEGSILITLTRWNEDDLAGRLLKLMKESGESDQWEVLSFPAIKEQEGDFNDPREVGEALWPYKYDLDKLSAIKASVGSKVWASLYQQRPSPEEGGLIKKEWFNRYNKNELPNNPVINFYLDTAYTEKQQNDPTVIMAYTFHMNKIYILRVSSVRKDFPELIQHINSFCNENGYTNRSKIVIEPKASGLSVIQQLKKATALNVVADKPPKDSKVTRVNSVSAIIESGKVLIPESDNWVDNFLAECSVFPNGAHDDQVDCLVGSINQCFKFKTIAQMI